MTLIITVLTRKHVVQVSDRRTTWSYPNGKTAVASENENKAIYVIGSDCHFAVSYTGLARIDNKTTTDDWLSGKISSANVDFQPYEKLKAELDGTIIKKLKHLARKTGLDTTIIVAGFRSSPSGETLCFVEPISTGHLPQRSLVSEKLEHIIAYGAVGAISDDVICKVRTLSNRRFFRKESGETVAEELVSLVREISDHPKQGKFIGRDCMEIVVRKDSGIVSCRRHVYDLEKPSYPDPVTGSPIIVVSGWCLRFPTKNPKFSLNDLRIGETELVLPPKQPPKQGEIPFKNPPSLRWEHTAKGILNRTTGYFGRSYKDVLAK